MCNFFHKIKRPLQKNACTEKWIEITTSVDELTSTLCFTIIGRIPSGTLMIKPSGCSSGSGSGGRSPGISSATQTQKRDKKKRKLYIEEFQRLHIKTYHIPYGTRLSQLCIYALLTFINSLIFVSRIVSTAFGIIY